MSLFSWLSSGKKTAVKSAPQPDSSGMSRMDSTRPYPGRGSEPNGKPANRKSERMARRELLYSVVRESMAKCGVVSASYKFKVLSLDSRGRQFLVMIDLAREYGGESGGLAEIEATIAQSAKSRFDIVVTAVYWRMHDHVAVGANSGRPALRPMAPQASTPVLCPAQLQAATVPMTAPASAPAPASKGGVRLEPITSDEVEAFKRALATGVTGAIALQTAAANGAVAKDFGGGMHHGPQSYTLLTGFEDTELCEDNTATAPGALSATQYGELR